MTVTNPYISPALFTFLRELKQNNNRDWFKANQDRYEREVRGPLLRFIADFGLRLAEISPHFLADPRPQGGSLFRIYRDVRFSKDKSPYKTHVGVQFRHESAGRDAHAPGFYLHLEPDGVFAAVGLWQPEPALLARVRTAIAGKPERWQRAISAEEFSAVYRVEGDALKRPPQGFDPSHPFIEDLKRTEFIAHAPLTEAETCAPAFIDHYANLCRRATPFMEFLTTACGLSW